jgi:hypothetical protein
MFASFPGLGMSEDIHDFKSIFIISMHGRWALISCMTFEHIF